MANGEPPSLHSVLFNVTSCLEEIENALDILLTAAGPPCDLSPSGGTLQRWSSDLERTSELESYSTRLQCDIEEDLRVGYRVILPHPPGIHPIANSFLTSTSSPAQRWVPADLMSPRVKVIPSATAAMSLPAYESGIRSAVVRSEGRWWRLKGCGNGPSGGFPLRLERAAQHLPSSTRLRRHGDCDTSSNPAVDFAEAAAALPLMEPRGSSYPHTSANELAMCAAADAALRTVGLVCGNIPVGMYTYEPPLVPPPSHAPPTVRHTLIGAGDASWPAQHVLRSCTLFETMGDRRLGRHALLGTARALALARGAAPAPPFSRGRDCGVGGGQGKDATAIPTPSPTPSQPQQQPPLPCREGMVSGPPSGPPSSAPTCPSRAPPPPTPWGWRGVSDVLLAAQRDRAVPSGLAWQCCMPLAGSVAAKAAFASLAALRPAHPCEGSSEACCAACAAWCDLCSAVPAGPIGSWRIWRSAAADLRGALSAVAAVSGRAGARSDGAGAAGGPLLPTSVAVAVVMGWRVGREMGAALRALHAHDISWGTYADPLGDICNSHVDNAVVLPPCHARTRDLPAAVTAAAPAAAREQARDPPASRSGPVGNPLAGAAVGGTAAAIAAAAMRAHFPPPAAARCGGCAALDTVPPLGASPHAQRGEPARGRGRDAHHRACSAAPLVAPVDFDLAWLAPSRSADTGAAASGRGVAPRASGVGGAVEAPDPGTRRPAAPPAGKLARPAAPPPWTGVTRMELSCLALSLGGDAGISSGADATLPTAPWAYRGVPQAGTDGAQQGGVGDDHGSGSDTSEDASMVLVRDAAVGALASAYAGEDDEFPLSAAEAGAVAAWLRVALLLSSDLVA